MKTEVSELVEQLYDRKKSKRIVQRAFVERTEDMAFVTIGRIAIGDNRFVEFHKLVWLGYEIAIDSPYLEGKYR